MKLSLEKTLDQTILCLVLLKNSRHGTYKDSVVSGTDLTAALYIFI